MKYFIHRCLDFVSALALLALLLLVLYPNDSMAYTLDKATAVFRGFSLDFNGNGNSACHGDDCAYEIDDVGAGIWESAIDDVSTGGTHDGVDFRAYAMLTKSADKDVSYDWSAHYSGVNYDESTIKIINVFDGFYYNDEHFDRKYNGEVDEEYNNVSIGCNAVQEPYGYAAYGQVSKDGHCTAMSIDYTSGVSLNIPKDWELYVAVQGFKIMSGRTGSALTETGKNSEDPIGGNDLIVRAYINNGNYAYESDLLAANHTEYRDDHHTCRDSDRYTVYQSIKYSGPVSVPNYWGKVYYYVFAINTNIWGVKPFNWDDGTISDHESTIKLTELTDLTSENNAFVILSSMGFDGNKTGAFELDSISLRAWFDELDPSAHTGKVHIQGMMHGHDGTGPAAPDDYINPNATSGYLIWCKKPGACSTKFGKDSASEGAKDGDSIDYLDESFSW